MLLVLKADNKLKRKFLSAFEEELESLLDPNAEIVFLDVFQGSTIVVTQITTLEGNSTIDDVRVAIAAAVATVNSAAEAMFGSSDESGSGIGSGSLLESDKNGSGSFGVDGGSTIIDVSSDKGQRRRVLSIPSQQYHSTFDAMASGIIIIAGMFGLACYLKPSFVAGKDLLTSKADIEVAGSAGGNP